MDSLEVVAGALDFSLEAAARRGPKAFEQLDAGRAYVWLAASGDPRYLPMHLAATEVEHLPSARPIVSIHAALPPVWYSPNPRWEYRVAVRGLRLLAPTDATARARLDVLATDTIRRHFAGEAIEALLTLNDPLSRRFLNRLDGRWFASKHRRDVPLVLARPACPWGWVLEPSSGVQEWWDVQHWRCAPATLW